jgi:hypothetical protein
VAWRLGVEPTRSTDIPDYYGERVRLATDLVYDLGHGERKFHVPVKTSSRERSIMLWAHQRLLEGVYGSGTFIGAPVLLAETKTDKRRKEVVEICLPLQWRMYQRYISRIARIYYLDLPSAYRPLNSMSPPLHVKEFTQFFLECDTLKLA